MQPSGEGQGGQTCDVEAAAVILSPRQRHMSKSLVGEKTETDRRGNRGVKNLCTHANDVHRVHLWLCIALLWC